VKNDASVPISVFCEEFPAAESFFRLITPGTEVQSDLLEGQRCSITTNSPGAPSLSFTKGLFDETLVVTDFDDSLHLAVESPFDSYAERISSLLKACGFLNQEEQEEQQQQELQKEEEERKLQCLSQNAFVEIDQLLKQRSSLLAMRDTMAPLLRNYTCDDDALQTSSPLETHTEIIHDGSYAVRTLFRMESAQIFMIPNFLTPVECDHLVESSRSKLERAAVVGANGAAEYSDSRRAQQAGYYLTGEQDPLWSDPLPSLPRLSPTPLVRNLYARVLNFTNSHTNYGLRAEGQEEFTVIQYGHTDEYL
jgi:hypothetical protein